MNSLKRITTVIVLILATGFISLCPAASIVQFPISNYLQLMGKNTCGAFNIIGNSKWHLGDDINAKAGDSIYAISAGIVRHAEYHGPRWKDGEYYANYGGMYIIEHNINGNKVCALYVHMNIATFTKSVGQEVTKGEYLGQVGNQLQNGDWPEHFHFGIRKGEYPSNPNEYIYGDWIFSGYTSNEAVLNSWHKPTDFINTPPIDPLISGLASTTQPVRWYYIMNESTGCWYLISPEGEIVYSLDKVDQNTSFGVYWKPVNKATFQSYPSAGQNFSFVNIASDGRTIFFGPAISSFEDIHVAALANSTQPVRWFYIMNQVSGYWYIVSPALEVVYLLDRVDKSTSFGIFWKPINNATFQEYPAAGHNYTAVTVYSDGKTIDFGSLR